MQTKQFKTRVKMVKDDSGAPTGEVTAIVSVFGNVDLVGDRVVKGAFSKALADYRESGDPIPMIWSHDWANPMSHIGEWDASKAVETDEGLQLTGRVHINEGNPVADQAYRLMEKRLVTEFSFAYDVLDERKASDGANELLDLTLIEAGPTLKGANSETRLVAAKAMESALKAGRVLSAKNETGLREALDALDLGRKAIQNVLSALDAPEEKDADAETKDVAEAEAEVTVDESDAELEQEDDGTSEVDEVEETTEPEPITIESLAERLDHIEEELRIERALTDIDSENDDSDGA